MVIMDKITFWIMMVLGAVMITSCSQDDFDDSQIIEMETTGNDFLKGKFADGNSFEVCFEGFALEGECIYTDTITRDDDYATAGCSKVVCLDTVSVRQEGEFTILKCRYKADVITAKVSMFTLFQPRYNYLPFYYTAEKVMYQGKLIAEHNYTFSLGETIKEELPTDDETLAAKWLLKFQVNVTENEREITTFEYADTVCVRDYSEWGNNPDITITVTYDYKG
ncbi:MAG: hypothetical protein IJ689_03405 [Alphaproteobacteria bacterium]|nr:hypothetical protein [Alphaproteobacteria bacterium]